MCSGVDDEKYINGKLFVHIFKWHPFSPFKHQFEAKGASPHLLPLKEGGEGNPLKCTCIFISYANKIVKELNEFSISPRRHWYLLFVFLVML